METGERKYCCMCSSVIKPTELWRQPANLGGGRVPYCLSCQQKIFTSRAAMVGYKMALFHCCLEFNAPYLPEMFPEAKKNNKFGAWIGYMTALRDKGYHNKNGRCAGFQDGIREIAKALGGQYASLYVSDEMLEAKEYKEGCMGQVKQWGHGPKGRPYSQEDYEELDRIWSALVDGRPNVTAQTELAVEKICKWTVEQARCVEEGDFQKAKQLEDLIKVEMEAEQLRKKDELPQDLEKIHGIVKACEEKGLLGLSYPELMKKLHPNYDYPLDVADQVLKAIYNTSAWNENAPTVEEVPKELRPVDVFGEFRGEFDQEDREIYRKLGFELPPGKR